MESIIGAEDKEIEWNVVLGNEWDGMWKDSVGHSEQHYNSWWGSFDGHVTEVAKHSKVLHVTHIHVNDGAVNDREVRLWDAVVTGLSAIEVVNIMSKRAGIEISGVIEGMGSVKFGDLGPKVYIHDVEAKGSIVVDGCEVAKVEGVKIGGMEVKCKSDVLGHMDAGWLKVNFSEKAGVLKGDVATILKEFLVNSVVSGASFENAGVIRASEMSVVGAAVTNRGVMYVQGEAKFGGSNFFTMLGGEAILGHLKFGSLAQKEATGGVIGYYGGTLILTEPHAKSEIYGKSALFRGMVKRDDVVVRDDGIWNSQCYQERIDPYEKGCHGDPKLECSIPLVDPRCERKEIGKFISMHDVDFGVNLFTLYEGLFDVGGTVNFITKPKVDIYTENCARYATIVITDYNDFTKAGNFGSILKAETGIEHYIVGNKPRHVVPEKFKRCVIHNFWSDVVMTLPVYDADDMVGKLGKNVLRAGKIAGVVERVELGLVEESQVGELRKIALHGGMQDTQENNIRFIARYLEVEKAQSGVILSDALGGALMKLSGDKGLVKVLNNEGLDVNLAINRNVLATSKVYSIMPMQKALPAAADGCWMRYFVKSDAGIPGFDVREFLEQLNFQCHGVVSTTDGHYTNKLVQDAVFVVFGALNKVNYGILTQQLAQYAYQEYKNDGDLVAGEAIPEHKLKKMKRPILWPVWSNECGGFEKRCLSYKIYVNDENVELLRGSTVIVDEELDLAVTGDFIKGLFSRIISEKRAIKLNVGGDVYFIGNSELSQGTRMEIDAGGNFISVGEISGGAELVVRAANAVISGKMNAGERVDIRAAQQISLMTLVSIVEAGRTRKHYEKRSSIGIEGEMSSPGNVTLEAGGDVRVVGATLVGDQVRLKSNNGKVYVVECRMYDELVHDTSNYYVHYTAEMGNKALLQSHKDAQLGDIIIDGYGGVFLSSADVKADGLFHAKSSNGDIELMTSNDIKMQTSIYVDRGFFSKTTTTTKESESRPLASRIEAGHVLLTGSKDIILNMDIVTHAVDFDRTGATKEATIALLPKLSAYSYEVTVKKSGLLFEFSRSGHFMLVGSKSNTQHKELLQVMPTIVQLGGYSNNPDDVPHFFVQSKGVFKNISSHIKKSQQDGLTKISIDVDNIENDVQPDRKFVFAAISESGIGIGGTLNFGEVSIRAGLMKYDKNDSVEQIRHNVRPTYSASEIELKASEKIRDIAALYDAERMNEQAVIILYGIAQDSTTNTHYERHIEGGLKLGIKTGALGRVLNSVKAVATPHAHSPEDYINYGFLAYQGYHDFIRAASGNSGASGGLWDYANYGESSTTTNSTQEIPTQITVGIYQATADDISMYGAQIEAIRAYISATSLDIHPSKSTTTHSSSAGGADVDIPICSSPSFSTNFNQLKADFSSTVYINTRIHIHNDISITISGKATIQGLSLDASSVFAFFDSLLLESVSDLHTHSSWAASLGLSSVDISSVSAKVTKGSKNIVNTITEILGSEKCNIIVAHALGLNGAMIAAASRAPDGSLTEHGLLTVKAGELFVQYIHEHDKGHTLGLATQMLYPIRPLHLLSTPAPALDTISPTIGLSNSVGTVYGAIGNGTLIIGNTTSDSNTQPACTKPPCSPTKTSRTSDSSASAQTPLSSINRDIFNARSWTKFYDIHPVTAYIPIGPQPELPKTADDHVDWQQVKVNIETPLADSITSARNSLSALVDTLVGTSESQTKNEQEVEQPKDAKDTHTTQAQDKKNNANEQKDKPQKKKEQHKEKAHHGTQDDTAQTSPKEETDATSAKQDPLAAYIFTEQCVDEQHEQDRSVVQHIYEQYKHKPRAHSTKDEAQGYGATLLTMAKNLWLSIWDIITFPFAAQTAQAAEYSPNLYLDEDSPLDKYSTNSVQARGEQIANSYIYNKDDKDKSRNSAYFLYKVCGKNEVASRGWEEATELSYAGGKSSISFGYHQIDLVGRGLEGRRVLHNILEGAKDEKGLRVVTDAQLNEYAKILGTGRYEIIITQSDVDKWLIGKRPEQVFDEEGIKNINNALKTDHSIHVLMDALASDSMIYDRELQKMREEIKDINPRAADFYGTSLGILYFMDYRNQYGPPRKLTRYLKGEKVTTKYDDEVLTLESWESQAKLKRKEDKCEAENAHIYFVKHQKEALQNKEAHSTQVEGRLARVGEASDEVEREIKRARESGKATPPTTQVEEDIL